MKRSERQPFAPERSKQELALQVQPDQSRSEKGGSAEEKPVQEKKPADIQEAVRVRAYQIYEERGGAAGGSDIEDWLQAEAELRDVEMDDVDGYIENDIESDIDDVDNADTEKAA
jgi:hypothetical protein